MAWSFRQMEFAWARKARAVPPSSLRNNATKNDGGLTEWCRETAVSLGLPELARKVRVGWNSRMQTDRRSGVVAGPADRAESEIEGAAAGGNVAHPAP